MERVRVGVGGGMRFGARSLACRVETSEGPQTGFSTLCAGKERHTSVNAHAGVRAPQRRRRASLVPTNFGGLDSMASRGTSYFYGFVGAVA